MKFLIITVLITSFSFAGNSCQIVDEVLNNRDRLLEHETFSIDRETGMKLSKKLKIASIGSVILSFGLMANESLYLQSLDVEHLRKINAEKFGRVYNPPGKISFKRHPFAFLNKKIARITRGHALFLAGALGGLVIFSLDDEIDNRSVVKERDPLTVLLIESHKDKDIACELTDDNDFKMALVGINESLEQILINIDDPELGKTVELLSHLRSSPKNKKAKSFYDLHKSEELHRN